MQRPPRLTTQKARQPEAGSEVRVLLARSLTIDCWHYYGHYLVAISTWAVAGLACNGSHLALA